MTIDQRDISVATVVTSEVDSLLAIGVGWKFQCATNGFHFPNWFLRTAQLCVLAEAKLLLGLIQAGHFKGTLMLHLTAVKPVKTQPQWH